MEKPANFEVYSNLLVELCYIWLPGCDVQKLLWLTTLGENAVLPVWKWTFADRNMLVLISVTSEECPGSVNYTSCVNRKSQCKTSQCTLLTTQMQQSVQQSEATKIGHRCNKARKAPSGLWSPRIQWSTTGSLQSRNWLATASPDFSRVNGLTKVPLSFLNFNTSISE